VKGKILLERRDVGGMQNDQDGDSHDEVGDDAEQTTQKDSLRIWASPWPSTSSVVNWSVTLKQQAALTVVTSPWGWVADSPQRPGSGLTRPRKAEGESLSPLRTRLLALRRVRGSRAAVPTYPAGERANPSG
jgi:hypothetical protein